MITKPTVLILGAGSASNYGFPLGQGLINMVCNIKGPSAKETTGATEAIKLAGYSSEDLNDFIETLRSSGDSSIDLFFERFPDFIPIGKAAIAAALIPLENPDKLKPPGATTAHWYKLLLNALDNPHGSFPENKLSVITFNYDRSLEYYLFDILSTRYRSEERAIEFMRRFEIVHVHGMLGNLVPIYENGRRYQPTLEPNDIRIAAEQIISVGEASAETTEFEIARRLLSKAKRIIFLGFGYHAENIRRLGIFNEHWDDNKRQQVRVSGTSHGIRLQDWQNIQSHILNGAFPPEARSRQDVYTHLYEVDQLDD